MSEKPFLKPVSCALALAVTLALGGCGGDDDDSPLQADRTTTTTTAAADDDPGTTTTVEGAEGSLPTGTDVLDGRDPCTILDQATVAQVTGFPVVTAETNPSWLGGMQGCGYNSDESGVTTDLYFLPAGDLGPDDLMPGRDDRSDDTITVPGADEAWVSRSEAMGQPEVLACATAGDVLTCAYTTDFLDSSLAQLEPMSTQLVGLVVEAL